MSGGSYDYAYYKFEEVADQLLGMKSAKRRAFGKHLKLVAKAMYEVEWVDSGDKGDGDEDEALQAVLGDLKARELEVLIQDAKSLRDEIDKRLA